ncbi:sensor histidine kinase [Gynurincola endophyticus]|uniref:sensor histidine kinase n=1 Tax=Gynurincola endophyticus TaxID=2479004 RepID=UPI000F8DF299|nr:HAMP domain-containing sensor histidine kinase [Gynurincola endophyticus]
MKSYNRGIYIVIGIFIFYTLIFSGYVYYSFTNLAFNDFYKRMSVRAQMAAQMELGTPSEVENVRDMYQGFLEKLPDQREYFFLIENNRIIKDSDANHLPNSLFKEIIANGSADGHEGILFYSGIRYDANNGNSYAVIVTADNFFYSYHIRHLRSLLISSLVLAFVMILIVSRLVKNTLTNPVRRFVNELDNISSENLHMRLDVRSNKDPLNDLTNKFNDMLNRLEAAFATQKNFISNASHELNTPLTSIIGEADLALSKNRTPEEYQLALGNILEEAEKLDKKTKALLLLARTGFNGKSQVFDKLRVDQLLMDVKETVQRINSRFKIKIDFSLLPENPEKLKVKGNEQLLHLALSNIIENACKYSDYNMVQVALGASDEDVVIIIRDNGIGIPDKEIQYIYDPYFRASNTGNYEGYGIGLPLSRNIILMHKGKLLINSVLGEGTTVQINLPIGNYKL